MHLAFYPTSGESARCERHGKVFSKASSDGQIPHVASTAQAQVAQQDATTYLAEMPSTRLSKSESFAMSCSTAPLPAVYAMIFNS